MMIHNIDERKKTNTRQSVVSGSLREEELARLIEEVEAREMLHAPAHLKENVLRQVTKRQEAAQKRQLFSYRAKVLTGMAAALAVLFLVPVDGRQIQNVPGTEVLGQLFERENGEETLRRESLVRQEEIERSWQKYREEQEKAEARRQYRETIESKLMDLQENIFE